MSHCQVVIVTHSYGDRKNIRYLSSYLKVPHQLLSGVSIVSKYRYTICLSSLYIAKQHFHYCFQHYHCSEIYLYENRSLLYTDMG